MSLNEACRGCATPGHAPHQGTDGDLPTLVGSVVPPMPSQPRRPPGRDNVERTLAALREAAATDANLMPRFLECARARASQGEMVSSLQQVFGRYTESPVF